MNTILVPSSSGKAALKWTSWPGIFLYCLAGIVLLSFLVLCEFTREMIRRL